MTTEEMKQRTKDLALRVMKLVDHLPDSRKGRVIVDQILRSATSVGANYRSACRGRSRAEFAAKLGVALEEADETGYWLELIVEGGLITGKRVKALQMEAGEITAMLAAALKSTRQGER